jgi:hypothetical protein
MARSRIRASRYSLLMPLAIAMLSLALSYIGFANTYRAPVLQCNGSVETRVCLVPQKNKIGAKFHLNSIYPFS